MWRLILLCLLPLQVFAQEYEAGIDAFRNNYISEHLLDDHSPITYKNVQHLRFFEVSEDFKVECQVELIKDAEGFQMHTHSGAIRTYYKYAKLTFELNNVQEELYVYRSKRSMASEEYTDYLFLPFTDDTNYKTTFGGGRYIDLKLADLASDTYLLDFNRCYNPYCAYAGGYSCPIPPKENDLLIKIEAGESNYAIEPSGGH